MILDSQLSDLNRIGSFLARRDFDELSARELDRFFGSPRVDIIILLGSAVLHTAEQAVDAFRAGLASDLLISGGIGHSTSYLAESVRAHQHYSHIKTEERTEADILADVVCRCADLDRNDLILEQRSTNCGANAEASNDLLSELGRDPKRILLIQDPTMQRRTHASFDRVWAGQQDVCFGSFATFVPQLTEKNGVLCFKNDVPDGLWDVQRYLELLMGEIPRLRDDENGYGPKGKGFIAHVDIPDDVLEAYERLIPVYATHMKARFSVSLT